MKPIQSVILILLFVSAATGAIAQGSTKEINYEGLKIIFKKTPKEVVTASFFVRGGTANIKQRQQGIEALALRLAITGGTKTMDKDAFATLADNLGTSFSSLAQKDYSRITMTCLSDNFDKSWAMFTDAILVPAMDENEFKVTKDQMIADAKIEESDPDSYLRKMATEQLFGGTDYAKSPNGTPATLDSISLADVKNYYATLLGKKKCYLVVVGNIDETNLLNNIKTAWQNYRWVPIPKYPALKALLHPLPP